MTDNLKMLLYFQLDARSFAQGTINEGTTLFSSAINLENAKEFDSSNNHEDGEWFFIELSSENDQIIPRFQGVIDNSVNTLLKENYTKVNSVFMEQGQKLFFQRIYPTKKMDNLFLDLFENDNLKIRTIRGFIISENQTDAILSPKENRLYFKDYSKIKSIFPNIDIYYREATSKDIESFANQIQGLADFSGIGNIDNIRIRNRKAIAALTDDADLLENILKEPISSWVNYAKRHEMKHKISFEGGKFEVSSNKNLTDLLKILTERFYTGEVTGAEKEAAL